MQAASAFGHHCQNYHTVAGDHDKSRARDSAPSEQTFLVPELDRLEGQLERSRRLKGSGRLIM